MGGLSNFDAVASYFLKRIQNSYTWFTYLLSKYFKTNVKNFINTLKTLLLSKALKG
jgi:hypothetical protein